MRTGRLCAAALAVVLALGGCSDDESTGHVTTASTAGPSTTEVSANETTAPPAVTDATETSSAPSTDAMPVEGRGLLVNVTTDDTWSANMAFSLATNAAGRALYPYHFEHSERPNTIAFLFLDPRARDFFEDWKQWADQGVHYLRNALAREPGNRLVWSMVERLRAADLGGMRFRDRTAHAVRLRLELADKELVRRGMALFALPQNAATGARLIWETSDEIWTALGDTSKDYNWYTKRTTLAGVYSSTALYWLGDQSAENADTWAFLDRRIENVMQFEKVKAQVTKNPLVDAMLKGPGAVLDIVRAPRHSRGDAR